MKQTGKELPRRAVEQYESSRKVKPKNVQKGDLVFFDSGSGISHVGLIISEKIIYCSIKFNTSSEL